MKKLAIDFPSIDGKHRYSRTIENLTLISRPDVVERHEGEAECVEFCVEVPEKKDRKPPLWFHAEHHKHEDGRNYTLYRVCNDSAHEKEARGYEAGQLMVSFDGRPIIHTRPLYEDQGFVELFDQTSFCGIHGTPYYAPDRAAIENYLRTWDLTELNRPLDKEGILQSIRKWWSKVDTRGEDHWPDTNITGSAGARYHDYRFLAWLLYPEEHGPALPLTHWVVEQFGTAFEWSDKGEREWRFVPGRPYSLMHYRENETPVPWERRTHHGEDPVIFGSGTIQNRRGRSWQDGVGVDTLGRLEVPVIDVRDTEEALEWLGCRTYGFPGTRRGRITARGRNGHDPEHNYRDIPTWTACLLTPSIMARNLLICHMETSTVPEGEGAWDLDAVGKVHSSRAYGWNLGLFARGAHLFNSKHYAGEVAESIIVLRDRAKNGLIPEWAAKDPRIMLSRERQRQFWPDAAWTNEATWQAAVIGEALITSTVLLAEGNRDLLRPELAATALNLAKQCSQVSQSCFDPEKGLTENWRVYNGEQESEPSGTASWLGTRHWTPNVGAAFGFEYAKQMWDYYRRKGNFAEDKQRRTWEWHHRNRLKE